MKLLFLTVGLLCQGALGDVFSFTSQPATMTVEKGDSFTLSCATENGDSTTYQWYHQDTVPNTIMSTAYSGSDATSATISVAAAALSHGGFYQCKATSAGQHSLYSETAKVTIHYFNTVSQSSVIVTIDSDTKAVRYALACDLDDDISYPDASITWYKDDEVISDENAFVIHADTSLKVESLADLSATANSLIIFNIKTAMAGRYRCDATVDSNKISVTTQTVVTYDVIVSQEFGDVDYISTTRAVNGDSVTAGGSVTLCCGTIGYSSGATPTYTWHATNGDSVAVTAGISDWNRTMTLDSATASHSYTCKACLAGSCESSVVTASVTPSTDAISFTTEPSSYYLYEDGSSEGALTITCKTSLGEGNWMKNGESVSFPIASPASSDSGYYQCYASNTDTWVMVSTQVEVTEAMTLDLSVPEELDSATTGTITCSVSGYPTPSVTLYKTNVNNENENIDECYDSPATSTNCIRNSGNNYYITVDNNDLDSTGTYTCEATQTYMASSGADKVKLSEDSGELAVIQDVSVTGFSTDSADLEFGTVVTFTCVVSGGRAPYKVEMKYENADVYVWSNNEADQYGDGVCTGDFVKTCKGKITSVDYSHEGTMTCTGYNTASNSTTKTASMSLETSVTRAVFTEVSGDFFPVLGTHLTLTCTHHEKPFSFDESVTWSKDGDSIVPDSSTAGSVAASYYGTVVGVFNDMTSDSEGTYMCTSESVDSAEVEVFVGSDTGIPPSDPSMTVPDGEVGVVMTLTCSAEGYPPPTLAWTLYDNSVSNVTTVSKEKYETTSVLVWSPSTAVEMTITCTATNDNGTAATDAVMTIITAEQANENGLADSEVAAIIAASIIAGVILFICIAFVIICVCQHRRAKQHDGDGTIIEKGPSKLEQTCLASCIACCPCCFKSDPSDTELDDDKPDAKWTFPSLPSFNFSFITSEKVASPPAKKSYFKRNKADVTKLSKREKMADSPEPIKKKLGSLRDSIKQKISPDDATTSKPGSPTAEKRSALKRPSFKRSHHSLPRGTTPSKDKGKERSRRNSAEDTPFAMKISHFFHIDSPFIKYDEEKQEYERTLSRVSKTQMN